MKYRITEPHTSGPGDALVVSKGETLRFERMATEWVGWLWCITDGGRTGWVPEAWVEIEGDTCVMLREYDATELAVAIGDEVTGDLIESGWVHVRNDQGRTGWVPERVLVRVDES